MKVMPIELNTCGRIPIKEFGKISISDVEARWRSRFKYAYRFILLQHLNVVLRKELANKERLW